MVNKAMIIPSSKESLFRSYLRSCLFCIHLYISTNISYKSLLKIKSNTAITTDTNEYNLTNSIKLMISKNLKTCIKRDISGEYLSALVISKDITIVEIPNIKNKSVKNSQFFIKSIILEFFKFSLIL